MRTFHIIIKDLVDKTPLDQEKYKINEILYAYSNYSVHNHFGCKVLSKPKYFIGFTTNPSHKFQVFDFNNLHF